VYCSFIPCWVSGAFAQLRKKLDAFCDDFYCCHTHAHTVVNMVPKRWRAQAVKLGLSYGKGCSHFQEVREWKGALSPKKMGNGGFWYIIVLF